jgi:hypothetical protein
MSDTKTTDELVKKVEARNVKLKQIIADLIPWVEPQNGPDWATEYGKKRNRLNCQKALDSALEVFPPTYNGFVDTIESDQDTKELARRCAEMQKVIDKLPKTADGVPIMPGMTLWVPKYATDEDFDDAECLVTGVTNYNACGYGGDDEESFHTANDDCLPGCDKNTSAKLAYSTREAALAAKEIP